MSNVFENPLRSSNQNPWVLLLSLIGTIIGGILFIGPMLAWIFVTVVTGDTSAFMNIIQNPMSNTDTKWLLMSIQGFNHLGGFFVAPLIFWYTMVKDQFYEAYFPATSGLTMLLLLTIMISFSFMVVDTVFIEWNESVKFPAALSGVEQWMRELENSMKELTVFLTKFDSLPYFIFATVVVAVLPGVGEELLFRGLLQNIFLRMSKNHHVAIWLGAFLFSAIHFQFYGLVPRMLLGALFGYLYYWSGNLIVPIVAHFFNNFLSLVALYGYQQGLTDIDPETPEALPWPYILVFCGLFIVLIVYFRKYISDNKKNDGLVGGI